MTEKIGLEAIFDTSKFKKGITEYADMVAKSDKATDKMADSLTRLGADFTMLQGKVSGMAEKMRASTPQNLKYAQTYTKIVAEFQKGKITSKQAADALDKLQAEMKQTGQAAKGGKQNIKLFWTELSSMMNVASMAARSIVRAGEQIYEFGKSGAVLENIEFKFDRLALTIGSTGDVIKEKLGEVMQGLLSEAEQMSLVTDLMSLGLVKTEDTAVRMANVVGQMGMDTNQLVLTLTNRTLMRFDALGVATDGFKERLKGLEDQGLSTEDAFTEAFLQQAELQLDKVGGLADQNIGSFMRLESTTKNLTDTMKKNVTEALAPMVEWLNEFLMVIPKIREELADNELDLRTNTDTYEEYRKGVEAAALELGLLSVENANYFDLIKGNVDVTELLTEAQWMWANQSEETKQAEEDLASMVDHGRQVVEGSTEATEDAVEENERFMVSNEELQKILEGTYDWQIALADATAAASAAAKQAGVDFGELAEDLSGLEEPTQLAELAIKALDQAYKDGKISAEEHAAGTKDIRLAYGMAEESGYLYAAMVTNMEPILRSGVIEGDKYSEALEAMTAAADNGVTSTEGLIQSLVDAGVISETAATKIVGSATYIDENLDLGEANAQLGTMAGYLAVIEDAPDSKNFNYTVTTTYRSLHESIGNPGLGGFYAEGGQASGGTPIVVGDGGQPEVFVPGSDGYVFPSINEFEGAFARAMQGSGSTSNYNMNMNVSPGQASQVSQNFDLMRLMR